MVKHVYILGAGYSRSSHPSFDDYSKYYEQHGYTFQVSHAITGDYSEIHKGAPLTRDLLKDAMNLDISQLSLHPKEKATFNKSRVLIKEWLETLHLSDYSTVSIQDVLTYLDMKMSKEAGSEQLSRIKFAMANLVSMLLYVRLGHSSQDLDTDFISFLRRQLAQLKQQDPQSEIIIINLNWDLVIDKALHQAFGSSLYVLPQARSGTFSDAHTFTSTPYTVPSTSIKLIKPHGSLNWMWCHGCEQVVVFEADIITRYILPFTEDKDDITCTQCQSREFSPVMVTPSLYRNVFHGASDQPTSFQSFLLHLWELLESHLQELAHLSIIGYSLPNEDKELRYYLREAIINSPHFKVLRIITGSPKQTPSREEMTTESYLAKMKATYQWDIYHSFFGSLLEDSFQQSPLNFWISGFYSYFHQFLK